MIIEYLPTARKFELFSKLRQFKILGQVRPCFGLLQNIYSDIIEC